MPRQARIDHAGLLYHIISRGIERRSIFKEDKSKEKFLGREEYEGGGLIRSLGGTFLSSQLRGKERELCDERILGSGDFVRE